MIKTSYFPGLNDFDISWPGRVSRHDLVYQAPPTDPLQYGMPIGNGDIGALLWCDDRKIFIAINKCDLWDDNPDDYLGGISCDEKRTTLRHACRIVIDFGIPVFDAFYLKDFQARVQLKDGCIVFHADTPMGCVDAEVFVGYEKSILFARVRTDFVEDDGINITLERYGSRTYSFWYNYCKRHPEIGLSGTDAMCKDGVLLLEHQLSTGNFVCALRPEGEGLMAVRRTCHMASAKATTCPKEFSFFVTVTSPLEEKSDVDHAISVLQQASEDGFDAMLAHNEACWKKFWETSFLETDNDYLDNLWHLGMYYACSGQRGSYPGRFINSMWNWNRDVQPWNYYYHWNQQETYWGLNAAGHHELCEGYLNYRTHGIPQSMYTAKLCYGLDNALFVSDVSDRNGKNSCTDILAANNHTPVAEIALDFWRQYLYTCDLAFLKEKALPYLLGAARFAATCFVKEADGRYHAKGGTPYEGSDILYDVVTELAMARALFPAVLKALEDAGQTDPQQALWQDIAENIADFTLLEADERLVEENADGSHTVLRGVFKGKNTASSQVISVGKLHLGKQPHHDECMYNGEYQIDYEKVAGEYVPHFMPTKGEAPNQVKDGYDAFRQIVFGAGIPNDKGWGITRVFRGHPQAITSAVFPMSSIGLKDKGSELYNAAVTSAMTMRGSTTFVCGWDPLPIVLARLGRAEELDLYMNEFPSNWQFYNNGFTHYGPFAGMYADAHMPFRRGYVSDADKMGERYRLESFSFRHMGLEPISVLMAAMNERLMQSFDGVIRVAPSYGKRNAKFKLHAVGGFEVMAQIHDGEVEFVAVRSRFGKPLKLENPWEEAYLNGRCFTQKQIRMDTVAGETYLFVPAKDAAFDSEKQVPADNAAPKIFTNGMAMLGTERCF